MFQPWQSGSSPQAAFLGQNPADAARLRLLDRAGIAFLNHGLPNITGKPHEQGEDMAGSVNKVILIGNLGRDPEVRSFQNGGKVVNLRIATSETWRDRTSGERKERTEWHSVAIFNEPLGKIAEQYLKKGSTVYIEGQLETRKWQDQSGQDRYTTEIVLRPYSGALTLLGGRGEGAPPQDDPGVWNNPGQSGDTRPTRPQMSGPGSRSDLDDDIPF